jgi:hypothetical protein
MRDAEAALAEAQRALEGQKKSKQGPQSLTGIRADCRELELRWQARKVGGDAGARRHRLLNAFIDRYEEMLSLKAPADDAEPEAGLVGTGKRKKKRKRQARSMIKKDPKEPEKKSAILARKHEQMRKEEAELTER